MSDTKITPFFDGIAFLNEANAHITSKLNTYLESGVEDVFF